MAHKIDYRFNIKFNNDGITVSFTGESIELIQKETEEAIIRPRHIKLIAELQQFMRDYIEERS